MSDNIFAQKVNFLIPKLQQDLGITKEQAAGIVGSLAAETGGFRHYQELTPVGGRGGWGWAQWTGKRRRAFEKKYGHGNRSDEANYGMLVHELTKDSYWKKELTRLKRAKTVSAAARAFTGSARSGTGYLRPGVEHYKESDRWAHKALEVLRQKPTEKKLTGHRTIKDLIADLPPERQEKISERTQELLKELQDEKFQVYEKTLELISLVNIVDNDEVNTIKLRALVSTARDVLDWGQKPEENNT
jgi:hypothetical protein